MNGAEAILTTARDAGIDVCFANPAFPWRWGYGWDWLEDPR